MSMTPNSGMNTSITSPTKNYGPCNQLRKDALVTYARKRLKQQHLRLGEGSAQIEELDSVLNPKALLIGFARRFATYKRAALIFRDIERLHHILSNPERPVQIIFAGKAHPADDPGKALI